MPTELTIREVLMFWSWKTRPTAPSRAPRDDEPQGDDLDDGTEPQVVEVVWRRPPDAPVARRVRAVRDYRLNDDASPV